MTPSVTEVQLVECDAVRMNFVFILSSFIKLMESWLLTSESRHLRISIHRFWCVIICAVRTDDFPLHDQVTWRRFWLDQLIVNIRFQAVSIYCWFSVTFNLKTSAFSQQKKKTNKKQWRRRKKEQNLLRKYLRVELIDLAILICDWNNKLHRGSMTSILEKKRFNIVKYIIADSIEKFVIKLNVSVSKRHTHCFNGIYMLWIVTACNDIIC